MPVVRWRQLIARPSRWGRSAAEQAGAVGSTGSGIGAGMELAAVGGLGLEAAVAIASAVYFAEHGVIFWLLGFGEPGAAGDGHLAVWIAVAVAMSVALVALVSGRRLLAFLLSLAVSVYLLVITAVLVDRASRSVGSVVVFGDRGGSGNVPGGLFSLQYGFLVATPALVGVAVVATVLAGVSGLRGRRRDRRERTFPWPWLVPAGGLALLFALVGDGSGAIGGAQDLSFSVPPQGGIMTALQWVWGLGVLGGLIGSRFDPRIGWATAVLSLPFVGYQVSGLTLGQSYYGELFEPWWQTNLPLILSLVAIVLLTISSILTGLRMRASDGRNPAEEVQ